ncbi:MAG: hypothetical protein LBD30_08905, partial [Verrucomicrobiales bacterium]|nr:hypothetical protein [Verrucomicrobiales bacterium]
MLFSRKNIAAFCCLNALTAALLTVVCFNVCGIDADVWGLLFSLAADCGHYGLAGLLMFVPLMLTRL